MLGTQNCHFYAHHQQIPSPPVLFGTVYELRRVFLFLKQMTFIFQCPQVKFYQNQVTLIHLYILIWLIYPLRAEVNYIYTTQPAKSKILIWLFIGTLYRTLIKDTIKPELYKFFKTTDPHYIIKTSILDVNYLIVPGIVLHTSLKNEICGLGQVKIHSSFKRMTKSLSMSNDIMKVTCFNHNNNVAKLSQNIAFK